MNNTIVASVHFSFKGESYDLSTTLDLDAMMARDDTRLNLHSTLARLNDVDSYSYLYEVMEAAPLEFSGATALAEPFLVDGQFDIEGFRRHWQEQQIHDRLATIARDAIGVEDLDSKPKLKAALFAAWRAGVETGGH